MKINLIVDNPKSWYWPYAENLCAVFKKAGHNCDIFSKQSEVDFDSDITFFLSCEEYISKETRDKSKFNIVIHASDLPKGKGMSPTTWQILEGKNEIPITLIEVADKFDAGDYYIKDSFKLDGSELIDEWQEKLGQCIERMAINFVEGIGKMKSNKQKGEEGVYRRRTSDDSKLDINKTIFEQFDLLRVVDNEKYPAFFDHLGHRYIIKIFKKE